MPTTTRKSKVKVDTETPLLQFIRHLDAGEFDDQIKYMWKLLQERSDHLRDRRAANVLASLSTGDRVKIQNLKPKYIVGYSGTVESIDGDKVTVDLGRQVRRYGPIVIVPASCLIKL